MNGAGDPLEAAFIHAKALKNTAPRVYIKMVDRKSGRISTWAYRDPRTWGTWEMVRWENIEEEFKNRPDWILQPRECNTALLGHKSSRTVKDVLLDQQVAMGLGNYLVCEVLHRLGAHPHLSWDVFYHSYLMNRLAPAVASLLDESLAADNHDHWRVFRRQGKLCMTCRTPIERIKDPGSHRGSYFCPKCQARPNSLHWLANPVTV